ncbi:hypothetical protein CYMTET_55090 [Cymbomonas tetramitiformis]|uniref:Uncharacterized protein n=1 Tax=Cymbomonas tetramitiformis TaxID=36881 RepID=A0AAE0BEJ5_9CHLO|nr:hypothetical protein CYMTET_55090 [Cymbomonas tetramitiformis]
MSLMRDSTPRTRKLEQSSIYTPEHVSKVPKFESDVDDVDVHKLQVLSVLKEFRNELELTRNANYSDGLLGRIFDPFLNKYGGKNILYRWTASVNDVRNIITEPYVLGDIRGDSKNPLALVFLDLLQFPHQVLGIPPLKGLLPTKTEKIELTDILVDEMIQNGLTGVYNALLEKTENDVATALVYTCAVSLGAACIKMNHTAKNISEMYGTNDLEHAKWYPKCNKVRSSRRPLEENCRAEDCTSLARKRAEDSEAEDCQEEEHRAEAGRRIAPPCAKAGGGFGGGGLPEEEHRAEDCRAEDCTGPCAKAGGGFRRRRRNTGRRIAPALRESGRDSEAEDCREEEHRAEDCRAEDCTGLAKAGGGFGGGGLPGGGTPGGGLPGGGLHQPCAKAGGGFGGGGLPGGGTPGGGLHPTLRKRAEDSEAEDCREEEHRAEDCRAEDCTSLARKRAEDSEAADCREEEHRAEDCRAEDCTSLARKRAEDSEAEDCRTKTMNNLRISLVKVDESVFCFKK